MCANKTSILVYCRKRKNHNLVKHMCAKKSQFWYTTGREKINLHNICAKFRVYVNPSFILVYCRDRKINFFWRISVGRCAFFKLLQNTLGQFQILNTQPLKTLGLISGKWPRKYISPIAKISDYSIRILRTFFCFCLFFVFRFFILAFF